MIKLKNLLLETEEDDARNQLRALAIDQLKQKIKNLQVELLGKFPQLEDLSMYLTPAGALYLDTFRVKEGERRKGIGSKVLYKIKKFADDHDLYVVLHPFAMRGFKKKLDRFYKHHGFIPNKGRKKLYQFSSLFHPTSFRRPASKEKLKEMRSPYPKPTVNDKRRGYIGIVSNGRVYGYNEMIPDAMHADHSEIEYQSRHGRFRYFVEKPERTILWTDYPPSPEEKFSVEDWLSKKGEIVKRHVDYARYIELL